MICKCVSKDLLASKFRWNKFHWTASLRLTAAALDKVLKSTYRLLSHLPAKIHLAKLLLGHLHKFSLILNLTLSKLKCVIGDYISRNYLSRVLASHHQVLLSLLILEVTMRQTRLPAKLHRVVIF